MTGRTVTSPLPAFLASINPDTWTQPFWDAGARRELVAPRCVACGEFRMPPSSHCWSCRTQDIEWVTLPGTGTLYTFTVVRHAPMPPLADAVPFVVAVVELDGAPGARLVVAMVDVDVDAVRIGQPVEIAWEDVDGAAIPRGVLPHS